MRGQAAEAARDLIRHIDRMAENWAEMAPREGMSAEEYERQRQLRNRELWAPLHVKADRLAGLLPSRRSWFGHVMERLRP